MREVTISEAKAPGCVVYAAGGFFVVYKGWCLVG
jgi:hypothetical protein